MKTGLKAAAETYATEMLRDKAMTHMRCWPQQLFDPKQFNVEYDGNQKALVVRTFAGTDKRQLATVLTLDAEALNGLQSLLGTLSNAHIPVSPEETL